MLHLDKIILAQSLKTNKRFDVNEYIASREEGIRSIVGRLSRGNVSLQMGQYITADQLEKMRDRLAEKYK